MTIYMMDGSQACAAKFEFHNDQGEIFARMRSEDDKKLLKKISKMQWSEGLSDGIKTKETLFEILDPNEIIGGIKYSLDKDGVANSI